MKRLAVACLALWIGWAGVASCKDTALRGIHRQFYEMTGKLLTSLPVPPSRIGKDPLIYVEDRSNWGEWGFGGLHLFQFAYRNPRVTEKVVSSHPSAEQRTIWLNHPNAWFFRYDDRYVWSDASAEFRRSNAALAPPDPCKGGSLLPQCTALLVVNGLYPVLISRIETSPGGAGALDNFLVLYHYGFSLQQVGRPADAVRAYDRSIELHGGYFYSVLNRAVTLARLGRRKAACEDFHRARELNPTHPSAEQGLREWCQ